MIKLFPQMKSKIEKDLKKDSLLVVAKKYGVNRSTLCRYAQKHNIKLLYKRSHRPTDLGLKLVEYFNKHGLDKTIVRFKKDKRKVLQTIANWKFKQKKEMK